ncbi:MAG: protein kinase [Symploca sp. SIO3C6]|nr:protein kinase [Symploca sp. SIO3C6]
MTKPAPQGSTADNLNLSYCYNPDCQHPENPPDAIFCQSCGSNLLLQNRYRAIQLIGSGGFGRTFRAIDESKPSQPYCAIKQFFPQQQGSKNREKASELFRQEAERLSTLGYHPRIPQLLNYFEQEQHQYLVQEFIQGQNLAQELANDGPLTESEIRKLLEDLLPLLQFVHTYQVIHRDIKPENIIRRQFDGSLVLVDFGAAKFASETMLGKTGTVIGSAAYTSPEQIRGKAVYASDIYSLGVTCIHLLTEIPPFDLFDSSEDTWIWRHYLEKKTISNSLGKILDKMLQSATKRRYQSANEVLLDLDAKPTISTQKKWAAATILLALGLLGVRYFGNPSPQKISTGNPTVITQPSTKQSPSSKQPLRQTPPGGLYGYADNGELQNFPLQHTAVSAKISGNISRVEVRQTFANPSNNPIEAVYEFPLPDEAAVDDMEIRIGDRIIRGMIKKREQAQKIYEQAKKEGKTAGLLEQEKANIFTQSLANIQPREKVDVIIRYTNSLKFEGGDYEFAFPMVVGPRYTSGNAFKPSVGEQLLGGVAYASHHNLTTLPATRSGHDIDVSVEIDAGVPISEVNSPSHSVAIQAASSTVKVQLAKEDAIPNQDLILRYRVADASTQATVLTQSAQRGGHFATYLIPALDYQSNEIVPKDVVFLIDTSGSQSGAPIEQSQELMRQFINGLNPNDSFTIIDFSNRTTQLSPKPLANTPANRRKAIAYVNRLSANGGTELMNGIDTVLDFPAAPAGRLRSIVLLTDGLIGNDEQIIAKIQKELKPGNRLYSFGVGTSSNRFLINRLAELGRGTAEILAPNESAEEVAAEFFREINNPVLTNIEVSWIGSGKEAEIYPLKAPDLFANQPLVLFGRKQDRSNGKLRISGIAAGGKRYEKILNVNFDQVSGNGAIAQLWGRARIKDLMNQMYGYENPDAVKAVTDVALAYNLLSKYTAFVAVSDQGEIESDNTEAKSEDKKYPVAVPEPDQVFAQIFSLLLFGIFLARKRLKLLLMIK